MIDHVILIGELIVALGRLHFIRLVQLILLPNREVVYLLDLLVLERSQQLLLVDLRVHLNRPCIVVLCVETVLLQHLTRNRRRLVHSVLADRRI